VIGKCCLLIQTQAAVHSQAAQLQVDPVALVIIQLLIMVAHK